MKKLIPGLLIACCCSSFCMAQTNNVFGPIAAEMKSFTIDTSAVPNDKITKKIIELRSVKGGFNIDEALSYKMEEEKTKAEKPAAAIEKMANYFSTGHGRELLSNAVIWIYRKEFSYAELKKLVRFYKTSAGQKLSNRFPLVMLKTLAAAEIIQSTIK